MIREAKFLSHYLNKRFERAMTLTKSQVCVQEIDSTILTIHCHSLMQYYLKHNDQIGVLINVS